MAKRLVVGNWKMYVESPESAKAFAKKLRRSARQFSGVEVALAPSFVLIPTVAQALKGSNIRVAAQTLSPFTDGKRTGEVSARALKLAGATVVIVGHSERRHRVIEGSKGVGETDESIARQVAAADREGLRSVLCVGETEREGSGAHFGAVAKQLRAALVSKPSAARVVIAYEPVWAIGGASPGRPPGAATGPMEPQDIEEMIIYIRKVLAESMGRTAALRMPVLYGGSVEEENARELVEKGGVSGFLVGHASADIDSFLSILRAVGRRSR